MSDLAPQVSAFVIACEALHWRLLDGHALTVEERTLIKKTAIRLMLRAEGDAVQSDEVHSLVSGKAWRRWDEPLDREPHP
jgi:hypothetical protein